MKVPSCTVSDGKLLGIQEKRRALSHNMDLSYSFPSYLTLLTRWPGMHAPWNGVGQGAILTHWRNRTGGIFKLFKCTGFSYTNGNAEYHAVIID